MRMMGVCNANLNSEQGRSDSRVLPAICRSKLTRASLDAAPSDEDGRGLSFRGIQGQLQHGETFRRSRNAIVSFQRSHQ